MFTFSLSLVAVPAVMIIKNMEDFGVVNGSRGVIADFRTRGKGILARHRHARHAHAHSVHTSAQHVDLCSARMMYC